MKTKLSIVILVLAAQSLTAQLMDTKEHFTRKDSLQGGLRIERTSYDVQHYDLNVKLNIDEKFISGFNDIRFKVVSNTKRIQVDLFDTMQIDSLIFQGKKLKYSRDNNAVFVDFPTELAANSIQNFRFYYSGKTPIAKHAPWDGGFVFTKDEQGKPWVGVACQGMGASMWYPVKDSQSDEPDQGATIKVAVPNGLMDVSNGRLMGSEDLKNGYTRWDWEVKNPINTYDITINVADYAHIHDNHKGLDLDYYILKENEAKARTHFEEVKPMMDCYQSKFGTYPFAEDGYKLVETPYLGMEHQSAVAYGNKYKKGYQGFDLSMTGVGMLFDYITIHESGHEWFGNSITSKDIADMWIHEGFTQYTEIVFIECQFGYEKAMKYCKGLQRNVGNDKPIIGPYGVNKEGSGDMYPKGALMLNTLRHIINDDAKWWSMLLKYSQTYRHKIIDTETVVSFFNKESGMNLTPIFNQYLRYTTIPGFEMKIENGKLAYKWRAEEKDFAMPLEITIADKAVRLNPTTEWQVSKIKINTLDEVTVANSKFYVKTIN
ncbi:M1 family metallopeptidase [Flavobacterium sp. SUN046]|uniref:M1 family metallopeptidase n=1 Tax=Flavobacterium sp. SUN046 TaxID=3002440 RepID=UPI002DBDB66F|nr:M1 family metallopeptidase [Flavobacterium sp. SUN046]MEC4048469.1 M1 family metallopeptidase [Flavobacterium sp. SUN046]